MAMPSDIGPEIPFATPTVAEREATASHRPHHIAEAEASKVGPDLTPDIKQESRRLERASQAANPCVEEMNSSLRCLDENNYVHARCAVYQENYRRCRKFWDDVYRDRRRKDIHPFLPTEEERPKVEAHYRRLWSR